MTDMRGRHGRNFEGTILRISGGDAALNNFLDDADYVSDVEILSRRDITCFSGELAIQARAHARPKIMELARKHGLSVAG